MANLKISQLTTYTGSVADQRWFVMNNNGETETFKYQGYSAQVIPADGTESYVSISLPKSYAPNNYMYVLGNTNAASSGDYSSVWGGRNNKTNNQFGTVVGGYSNTAGYVCGVFVGGSNTITGNASAIIAGESNSVVASTFAMIGAYNNNTSLSNDVGNTVIGGHSNTLTGNGIQASSMIGGRSNYWNQSDSRDPVIGAPRYGLGVLVGGYLNRIEGQTTNSSGSHAYPLLLGGTNNIFKGAEGDDSATSGSSIINSYSSVMNKSLLSAIIASTGSTVSGRTQAVMIGTENRTATTNKATFVENLVVFNYASLDFADDTAAAAGGVVLGQVYHNAGALRIRIV
jgi:hypothetical protein